MISYIICLCPLPWVLLQPEWLLLSSLLWGSFLIFSHCNGSVLCPYDLTVLHIHPSLVDHLQIFISKNTECLICEIYTKFKHFLPCSLLSALSGISHLNYCSSLFTGIADFTSLSPTVHSQQSRQRWDHFKRHIRSFHSSAQNCTQLKDQDFGLWPTRLQWSSFSWAPWPNLPLLSNSLAPIQPHWPPCCLSSQTLTPQTTCICSNLCLEHSCNGDAHGLLPHFL